MPQVIDFSLEKVRVEKRSVALFQVASSVASSPAFCGQKYTFQKSHFDGLAAYYYLLNEAYKRARIINGHRTRPAKIAALSCLAISVIMPIRPASGVISCLEDLYINPLFAMRLGTSIVNHPLHLQHHDNQMRFCRSLIDVEFDFAANYANDFQQGIINYDQKYSFSLERANRSIVDMKVNMFEVLGELKIAR